MKIICKECGKEFELSKRQEYKYKKGDIIFCSRHCSGKYYANKQHSEETEEQRVAKNEKISKTLKSKFPEKEKKEKRVVEHIFRNCAYCGKEFELSRHQKARLRENENLSFCCSNLCGNRLKAKNRTGKHRNNSIRGQQITTNCAYCGKEFELNNRQKQKYVKDNTIKLFCSTSCRNRANAVKNTIERPIIKCASCGKEFELSSNQLTDYNKGKTEFYCSRSCIAKEHLIKKVDYKQRTLTMKKLLEDDEYVKNRTEKTQKTNLEKYGVINVLQLDDNIEKAKQTKLEKYGDENYSNREKSAKTYYEHYGDGGQYLSRISKINKRIFDLIDGDEFEFALGRYNYDIKKGNYLIEIDPTFTHNCCDTKIHNKYGGLDMMYHYNKTDVARKVGYNCIHIFDWDDLERIKYMLQDKQTLYARNLELKEVSVEDTFNFLNEYHLQGNCRGQEIRLGLYRDNELIEIMTFGKPRYNKNYEWELLRLCTHKDYKVVGGAEKLFKHFIQQFKPNSVISYCDYSKFSGDVYERLGFKQKGKITPSKHWSKNGKQITDNLLRQRGYDQLFNANYGKGTSNEELMLQNGWLPIYDCGQLTFIWQK